MTQQTTAIVRIQRYNPDEDRKPYWQDYEVPMTAETTILDAIETIKAELDGTLTFRRSCRHAICGSCAANVNGRNVLLCHSPLSEHLDRRGVCHIRPLPALPVIKDLVVDRTRFWEQYLRVKPWLLGPDVVPDKEFRISPEEVAALKDAEKCIMCGACFSACPVTAMRPDYIGPHALQKALMRVLDPRDTAPAERLDIVANLDGIYTCHGVGNCIEDCPKGLNPVEAIKTLATLYARREELQAQRTQSHETLIPRELPAAAD
ncbi:MAG: succinate dehydrogenase/fumarate reductase iron-sulfur subunit [Anaerolineae bacterium]